MTSTLAKSLARFAALCNRTNNAAETRICCSSLVRNVDMGFRRERHGFRENDVRTSNDALPTADLRGKPSAKKREMIRFLRGEIRLESESQKMKLDLPSVPGFEVTVDGSLLILTKDGDHENVKISVDVVSSLGREDSFNEDGEIDETVEAAFVARPSFQVDFQRDESTLVFRCSFVTDVYDGDEDMFFIEQFFVHDGSTNVQQFVGLPRFVGPELYDSFMSMLAERGVDNDFVASLQKLATVHEHRCYIRTLKDVVDFVAM